MSTGKTSKLNLNQWALTDRFMMEEFNADNRAIDAAVAALSTGKTDKTELSALANTVSTLSGAISSLNTSKLEIVKLRDVTTSARASSTEIGVADIDWSQFYAVILHFKLFGGGSMALKLGTGSQSGRSPYDSSGTNGVAQLSGLGAGDSISLFAPLKGASSNIGAITLNHNNSGILWSGNSNSGYSSLTKIVIEAVSSSYYLAEGSRIQMWGVK